MVIPSVRLDRLLLRGVPLLGFRVGYRSSLPVFLYSDPGRTSQSGGRSARVSTLTTVVLVLLGHGSVGRVT